MQVLRGSRQNMFWGVEQRCPSTTGIGDTACPQAVREIDIDGRVIVDRLLPDGWSLAASALDEDRLLLVADNGTSQSRLALWDAAAGVFDHEVLPPSGGASPFSILAAQGHQIAWQAYDCNNSCLPVLTDVRSGEQRMLAGPPGPAASNAPSAEFSPDGRYLAIQSRRLVPDRSSPVAQITVTDTRTAKPLWQYDGAAASSHESGSHGDGPGIISALTWDPSSRWLFFTVDSRLFAHHLRNRTTVQLGYFDPLRAFAGR
jgi:hypothetical protein